MRLQGFTPFELRILPIISLWLFIGEIVGYYRILPSLRNLTSYNKCPMSEIDKPFFNMFEESIPQSHPHSSPFDLPEISTPHYLLCSRSIVPALTFAYCSMHFPFLQTKL